MATDAENEFRSDERFQRLKNKLELEKKAIGNKDNTTALSRDFDLFTSSFSSAGGDFIAKKSFMENDYDEVFNPPMQKNCSFNQDSRYEQCSNKYLLKQQNDMKKNCHVEPKIQYKQIQEFGKNKNNFQKHEPSLDNIIDNLNKYNNKYNRSENYNSDRDWNNTPIKRNIDVDNYVRFGEIPTKSKSVNTRNYSEHYYQYIDGDIQDPKHVVNERPQSSRLSNKQQAQYTTNYK